MRNLLRSLTLIAAAVIIPAAMAQGYTVYVFGSMLPCGPANVGLPVTITTINGTQPQQTVTAVLDANCSYNVPVTVTDPSGSFEVSGMCGNTIVSNTGDYTLIPPFTTDLQINLSCGESQTCHACMDLRPAVDAFLGTLIPFTVEGLNCSTGMAPFTYNWSWGDGNWDPGMNATHTYAAAGTYNVCLSIATVDGCTDMICEDVVIADDGTVNPANPVPCNADFWVIQAYDGDPNGVHGDPIPNELWIWNLSSGGSGLFEFVWDFGDGETATDPFPTHTYATAGPYVLCLTITDSEGCTSTHCDSLEMDENGMLRGADGVSSQGFTINVMQPLVAGIDEQQITQVSSWPNPVSDVLNVALTSRVSGAVPVVAVDPSGRTVINTTRTLNGGTNQLSIATDDLTPGVYVLRIGKGSAAQVLRFVKTH